MNDTITDIPIDDITKSFDPRTDIQTDPDVPDVPTAQRPRIKLNLICASKCKKHAIEMARQLRPANKFTRVSEEFLLSCEVALKAHIHSRVKSHPSKGKTLT